MSHSLEADYEQAFLFPPCLEDWISSEHPARFIRAFVSQALADGLALDWGSSDLRGQPHYGAGLLLSVWLYGYFRRIRSTRRLEEACGNDVGMIWLCGNRVPDHNTLWRFFSCNGQALRAVFKQTVRVALKTDMVGFALHALDGTKVQAHVANRSGYHRKALEAALARLDETAAAIEAAVVEAETAEASRPAAVLPERMQTAEGLRDAIKEALNELDAAEREHLNPNDPDAQVMKCSDRNMNTFAYNTQVVVDEQSRLIVAERTTQEQNDARLLAEMVCQVEEECGQAAATTVADAGYAAITPLHDANRAGHHVLVNLPGHLKPDPKDPLKASNFRFEPTRNIVVCPLGEELQFTHTRWHNGKQRRVHAYRCRNKECPLRNQCSKDPKGRKIELFDHHEALQRQRDAHTSPNARNLLAKRRYIVEPIFAWIKQHLGFRRFTVTRLKNVQAQWSLLCTTYNLNRLYTLWKKSKPTQPKALSAINDTNTRHPNVNDKKSYIFQTLKQAH